jgi:hypothetical protein
MASATVTRKYTLTKIRAGDWLLLSNDGEVFWRIQQYEDGPSFGIIGWDRDKTLWAIWRWSRSIDELSEALALDAVDEEPDLWHYQDGHFETRKAAIDAALKKPTS